MRAIDSSGWRRISRTALSPPTRRNASICSPTVAETPGIVKLRRAPSRPRSSAAAWRKKPTAARGEACQMPHLSATGRIASRPASGSRMIAEKKPEAARLGGPGLTQIVGRRSRRRRRCRAANNRRAAIRRSPSARRSSSAASGGIRRRSPRGTARRTRRSTRRRPRAGDRRRPRASLLAADRLEQAARRVEVDRITLVEIALPLRPRRSPRAGRTTSGRAAISFGRDRRRGDVERLADRREAGAGGRRRGRRGRRSGRMRSAGRRARPRAPAARKACGRSCPPRR